MTFFSGPLPFLTGYYQTEKRFRPETGNHIVATFDSQNIIIYQAVPGPIATFASRNQNFRNCPDYKGWSHKNWTNFVLNPNFISMMRTVKWDPHQQRPNDEHILALAVDRIGFEHILRIGVDTTFPTLPRDAVVRWEFDYGPNGDRHMRNSLLVYAKNKLLLRYLYEYVRGVYDITRFVREQRKVVFNYGGSNLNNLRIPCERVYSFLDKSLEVPVGIDDLYPKERYLEQVKEKREDRAFSQDLDRHLAFETSLVHDSFEDFLKFL